MVLLVVLTPLINFLIFALFGTFVHCKQLAVFTIASMVVALGAVVISGPAIMAGDMSSTSLGVWAVSGLFEINWNFSVDALTYTMFIVVLTVSTLVHVYSTEYMSEDPHLPRFMSYLSLFTFFMLILITSDNFIGLFLGWEGVGLCSYLLISFWFTRIQANKAAIKAMIVNRIADLAFTVGVLVIFYTFQTVEFNAVFGLAPYFISTTINLGGFEISPLVLATFLLFIGATGKSAQIGLHTWLPDAMEGPTPVSALIHAATMVTAGVFLIIRCSPLFECVPSVLLFITFVGAATAFMAATSGLLQNDLKKVIAYSTCSQLGYMIFACGLSGYALSLFHLANHAFFKALLFLSAGAIIHAISSEQDLRRFGALARILPYTYAMFLIGSLALMGFPFLTGFYSKDIILEVAASSVTIPGVFAYWLGLITAFFTAFYSFRLLYLAFYGQARSPRPYLVNAHELTPRMAFALATLALGGIFIGYMARDIFIGFGTPFWNGVIHHAPELSGAQLDGEFLSFITKMTPFFGSIASVILVFVLNSTQLRGSVSNLYMRSSIRSLQRFLAHKWYFDVVYNRFINQPLLEGGYRVVFSLIDKGLLEFLGPTNISVLTARSSTLLRICQSGRVYDYAWLMIVCAYLCLALHALYSTTPIYANIYYCILVNNRWKKYAKLQNRKVTFGQLLIKKF
jgi:proton-translocating NADH-quinone oxidoreductase chain L